MQERTENHFEIEINVEEKKPIKRIKYAINYGEH